MASSFQFNIQINEIDEKKRNNNNNNGENWKYACHPYEFNILTCNIHYKHSFIVFAAFFSISSSTWSVYLFNFLHYIIIIHDVMIRLVLSLHCNFQVINHILLIKFLLHTWFHIIPLVFFIGRILCSINLSLWWRTNGKKCKNYIWRI